ncbi:MAG: cytochrome c-type biogenesis protein CcmH, partial [Alphaproteobacteria bacterium]|nr:cytochrome c-type biogenesis protein CcmH [Alphaproteobacteria bacterium]
MIMSLNRTRHLMLVSILPLGLLLASFLPNTIVTTAANAITAEEMLANPQLEERARNLSKQLRCLVCQNQSIDDSDADLARDLRREVRSQIAAGDSDDAIIGMR